MCDLTSTLFFVGCSAVDCSFYYFEVPWVLNLPQSPKTEYTYFDRPQKSLRTLQLNCLCHGCKGTKQLLHPLYGIVYPDKCGPICSTGTHRFHIIYGARHCTPSREVSATTVRLFQDVTQQIYNPALIFDMENRVWNTLSVGKGSTICCMAMTQRHGKDLR